MSHPIPSRLRLVTSTLAALGAAGVALPALADDNAVAAAADAFGTNVGRENVGLYFPFDVRGFSAIQAGNVRLDGLYFDLQVGPPSQYQMNSLISSLVSSSTIRVGLSALGFPFPAPTGIVDFSLRIPGNARHLTTILQHGPYGGYFAEVNGETPLVGDKLSIGIGGGYYEEGYNYGARDRSLTGTVILRARPFEGVELVPFWSRNSVGDRQVNPLIVTDGNNIPPELERQKLYGQSWALGNYTDDNYGLLARAVINSNWRLQTGLFRSVDDVPVTYNNLFLNTQVNGLATQSVVAYPHQTYASTSGEARLSGVFTEGSRRHTVHIAVKGRDRERDYGGSSTVSFGAATIGVPSLFPKPVFAFRTMTHDDVSQWNGALGYEGLWAGVGEVSLGVQKVDYKTTIQQPNRPQVVTETYPLLYNGTLAIYVTDSLALYAAYTRGLEESGVAPDNATNRGEAQPASLTSQREVGFRYAFTPALKLSAGLFDIRKPYFGLYPLNQFRLIGDVQHLGFETSFSGTVLPGLDVVAGLLLMDPTISGDNLDRTRIGERPVTRLQRWFKGTVEYHPAWLGPFSFDAEVQNQGARVASLDNRLHTPPRTTAHLGARYKFRVANTPSTVRLKVWNVTNVFNWQIVDSRTFQFFDPAGRRVTLTWTTEF